MLLKRKVGTVPAKFIRSMSSQNVGDSFQDRANAIFDDFLKNVEIMKEEYFTADTQPTKEEVHQEALRSAYLGRYVLDQTLDKAGIFTSTFDDNREKFDVLRGIEANALKRFIRSLPENKTRPSLLTPL